LPYCFFGALGGVESAERHGVVDGIVFAMSMGGKSGVEGEIKHVGVAFGRVGYVWEWSFWYGFKHNKNN